MKNRNMFYLRSSGLLACLAMTLFVPKTHPLNWKNVTLEPICEYWVAPPHMGSDSNPGTSSLPWSTLEHAAATVPDNNCIVWFKNGTYSGTNNLKTRFTTRTIFRAVENYKALFENDGPVIDLDGAMNMVFEGFEFQHSGSGLKKHLVIMDRRDDLWSEQITFQNNIFHDSYNNDLLKIHNGAKFVTIENNIFYNQGESEQHIDVNSVTDITIQDNIFFNDFIGSGRINTKNTKHFIVVKDSNAISDGLIGSQRIKIWRNIFLNWQGGSETFLQIGNDGKPYHEAQDVYIENNLLIGNSPSLISAAFGVRGAKNVIFNNNTLVGDLPSKAYAFRVSISESNPINENITFTNNIFSDPTGSMGVDLDGGPGEFSDGDPDDTSNLILDNNLYWNGGEVIPPGDLVSPMIDDSRPFVEDPLVETDQSHVVLPRWSGSAFESGNSSIRDEFVRLVEKYGVLPKASMAIGEADPNSAANIDILGRTRSSTPDLGAYEYQIKLNGISGLSTIFLRWSPPREMRAASLKISYSNNGVTQQATGIPITASTYTLRNLEPDTIYTISLTAHAEDDALLAYSNQLVLLTTGYHFYLPSTFNQIPQHQLLNCQNNLESVR